MVDLLLLEIGKKDVVAEEQVQVLGIPARQPDLDGIELLAVEVLAPVRVRRDVAVGLVEQIAAGVLVRPRDTFYDGDQIVVLGGDSVVALLGQVRPVGP